MCWQNNLFVDMVCVFPPMLIILHQYFCPHNVKMCHQRSIDGLLPTFFFMFKNVSRASIDVFSTFPNPFLHQHRPKSCNDRAYENKICIDVCLNENVYIVHHTYNICYIEQIYGQRIRIFLKIVYMLVYMRMYCRLFEISLQQLIFC